MPASNLMPSPANAAAAPASAAPAGAAPGPAGSSLFDAILVLEELVAAATDVGVDAGAAELGTEGADVAGEDPADDEENLEADDPLAFLAGLIAIAPHPHSQTHVATHGAGAHAGEGADALAGGAGGEADAPGMPFTADANPNAAGTKTDDAAAAAARALAAQAALANTDARVADDKTVAPRADLLAHASRLAPASADHAPIATHARDPRWADEFGTRIALLVNQRESVAAISLTPVDLGPVDVSVTVRDSQATIHFGAAQAETRALIEASLPKLRELLAAQGFQLLDASVSQGFTRQSKPDAASVPRPSSVDEVTPETRAVAMNGLLDTYA
jgi:flagellar hook-length control protein FliK